MNEELHKEQDATFKAAMTAKNQLKEMVLAEAIDHAEIDRLRAVYFTNYKRYGEIVAIFEAERQTDIKHRSDLRASRRAEAAGWSKEMLIQKTGMSGKRTTREQLIESYASMVG